MFFCLSERIYGNKIRKHFVRLAKGLYITLQYNRHVKFCREIIFATTKNVLFAPVINNYIFVNGRIELIVSENNFCVKNAHRKKPFSLVLQK